MINQLTYLSYISFFLVQEIFSVDNQQNSTINNNDQNDRIRCGRTCVASIFIVCVLIAAVTSYAIFRFRKRHLRQKTGHVEEIVAMKCKKEKRRNGEESEKEIA